MARPTNKQRFERHLWLQEWNKRKDFCLKFNMKTLTIIALKKGVTDRVRFSEKYRYKYASEIARKTTSIQDIWRILIND